MKVLQVTPAVRHLLLAGSLLLPVGLAAGVYAPFLHQWFVADDFIWLRAATNPDFGDFLNGALSPRGPTPYWRPVIDFYFFSMYRVFGLNGTAYHLTNLLLHGAVAIGTALLIWRISRLFAIGLLAGILFAVAPSYGIAVPWVSSVTELLSALLSIITLLLYLRYLDTNNRLVLASAVCTFVLALLAHENAAAVVPILIALSLLIQEPKNRTDLERLGVRLLPFLVIGFVFAIGQLARLYGGSQGSYLDWHAAERLAYDVRWLSLPLSSSGREWLRPTQWALVVGIIATILHAIRKRSWKLPALFACTIFALLPSSFLTFTFDPRWTYFAAVFWSGFLAILVASITRQVWFYNQSISVAFLVVLVGVYWALFVPEMRDAPHWMPRVEAQMEDLSSAIRRGCPALGPANTAYLEPIPVYDPGNTVPWLVRLMGGGPRVVSVTETPPGHLLPGDCVIGWSLDRFQATEVD